MKNKSEKNEVQNKWETNKTNYVRNQKNRKSFYTHIYPPEVHPTHVRTQPAANRNILAVMCAGVNKSIPFRSTCDKLIS